MSPGLPLPAALAATLLILLVAERAFLPVAAQTLYDARYPRCCLDNKADELAAPRRLPPIEYARAALGLPHDPDARLREGYNLLPYHLVWAASQLLPRILGYNLLHLLSFLLAATGAYLLSRQLGAGAFEAWIAGLLLCFSPRLWGNLRYEGLDQGMLFWVALALAALLRLRQTRSPIPMLLAGLALWGVGATNYYHLIGLTLAGLLLLAIPPSQPESPHNRNSLFVFRSFRPRLLAAAVLGLLFLLPQIRLETQRLLAIDDEPRWFMGFANLSRGPGFRPYLDMIEAARPWFLLLALLVLPALALRRGDRRTRLVIAVATGVIVGSTLALGHFHDEVEPLIMELPLLWRLRRLGPLLTVPLVLACGLAGAGLSHLVARIRRPPMRLAVRGLALAAVLCTLPITASALDQGNQGLNPMHLPEPIRAALNQDPDPRPFLSLMVPLRQDGQHALKALVEARIGRPGHRGTHLMVDTIARSLAPMPGAPKELVAPPLSLQTLTNILATECPPILVLMARIEPVYPMLTVQDLAQRLDLKVRTEAGPWTLLQHTRCP